MLKLHLGSGNKKIDGYVNIDIRYLPTVDRVDNVRFLRSCKPNSVDVIYASHVLEHFSRWDYKSVLLRWYELLNNGGKLRIAVPDFASICEHYIKHKDLRAVSGMMYGGQDIEENYHNWVWDYETLRQDLLDVGFNLVERYDWRRTEHDDLDDFSQSYLPHMDKENGQLMSLNIEATK